MITIYIYLFIFIYKYIFRQKKRKEKKQPKDAREGSSMSWARLSARKVTASFHLFLSPSLLYIFANSYNLYVVIIINCFHYYPIGDKKESKSGDQPTDESEPAAKEKKSKKKEGEEEEAAAPAKSSAKKDDLFAGFDEEQDPFDSADSLLGISVSTIGREAIHSYSHSFSFFFFSFPFSYSFFHYIYIYIYGCI